MQGGDTKMQEEPAAGTAAEADAEVKAEAGAEAKPEATAAAGSVDGATQEAEEVGTAVIMQAAVDPSAICFSEQHLQSSPRPCTGIMRADFTAQVTEMARAAASTVMMVVRDHGLQCKC